MFSSVTLLLVELSPRSGAALPREQVSSWIPSQVCYCHELSWKGFNVFVLWNQNHRWVGVGWALWRSSSATRARQGHRGARGPSHAEASPFPLSYWMSCCAAVCSPGSCRTPARYGAGAQRLKCFSSPRSPLVSQTERQILFQKIRMQVSGQNLLMFHIPK